MDLLEEMNIFEEELFQKSLIFEKERYLEDIKKMDGEFVYNYLNSDNLNPEIEKEWEKYKIDNNIVLKKGLLAILACKKKLNAQKTFELINLFKKINIIPYYMICKNAQNLNFDLFFQDEILSPFEKDLLIYLSQENIEFLKNNQKMKEILLYKYGKNSVEDDRLKLTKIFTPNEIFELYVNNSEFVTLAKIKEFINILFLNYNDELLKKFLEIERFKKMFIEKFPYPFFEVIVDKLHLDPNMLIKKNEYLNMQLQETKNPNDLKSLFCQRYFGNYIGNVLLDLETIIQSCEDDENLKNGLLKNVYPFLKQTYDFLKNNREMPNINVDIGESCAGLLESCFKICEINFKNKLFNAIQVNHTEGMICQENNHGVKVYRFENENDSQRNIPMLVSNVKLKGENQSAMDFYKMYLDSCHESRYNSRCCSIIDERHLDFLYGKLNSVCFGYKNLLGRKIINVTLSDNDGGVIDQQRAAPRYKDIIRLNRPNTLIDIQKIINRTDSHNEINVNMGMTGKILMPDYILSRTNEPTEFEFEVAKLFNIPIYVFNREKYIQNDEVEDDIERSEGSYTNFVR